MYEEEKGLNLGEEGKKFIHKNNNFFRLSLLLINICIKMKSTSIFNFCKNIKDDIFVYRLQINNFFLCIIILIVFLYHIFMLF